MPNRTLVDFLDRSASRIRKQYTECKSCTATEELVSILVAGFCNHKTCQYSASM